MRDFNTVILEGRLIDKAQTKTHNGTEFVSFRLASTEFANKADKKTLYIDCEWWEPNKAAEYLEKGKAVIVTGRLSLSEWTDKEDGKKRSKHFVKVEKLDLRGSSKKEDKLNDTAEENSEDFIASLSEVPF